MKQNSKQGDLTRWVAGFIPSKSKRHRSLMAEAVRQDKAAMLRKKRQRRHLETKPEAPETDWRALVRKADQEDE